jgi:hypothetical protein
MQLERVNVYMNMDNEMRIHMQIQMRIDTDTVRKWR